VDAEFTPNGARDEGSVGSEEPSRVTQRGTGNVVAEVVSVVGSVGELEGLRDQLNIDALAEFEVLANLASSSKNACPRSGSYLAMVHCRSVNRQA